MLRDLLYLLKLRSRLIWYRTRSLDGDRGTHALSPELDSVTGSYLRTLNLLTVHQRPV
jgi:hypothetical protein